MFLLFFCNLLQKATRKTDKPRAEEVEVTDLTDEDLKQQLAKHGVDVGPIVGEFAGFIHSCLHLRNKTNVIYQDGKTTDTNRKVKNIFKKGK